MAAGRLIEICPSSALRDGAVGVRFDVVLGGRPASAFVIRHRGQVAGFLNRCAHMPMELDWVEGRFFDEEGERLICATHGAEYEPGSGRCAGGPCGGRGLVQLTIHERDDRVVWEPERDERFGVAAPTGGATDRAG